MKTGTGSAIRCIYASAQALLVAPPVPLFISPAAERALLVWQPELEVRETAADPAAQARVSHTGAALFAAERQRLRADRLQARSDEASEGPCGRDGCSRLIRSHYAAFA